MTELQRINELAGVHIGLRVRLQSIEGGFIEGTLAKVTHKVNEPYGTSFLTYVELDEFLSPSRDNRIPFWINGVDSAMVIDE
jgi:hypothetical protein